EALRRQAVLRHQTGDGAAARALCRRSHAVALAADHGVLAAKALNTLGAIEMTDSPNDARMHFVRALELGGHNRALRARVEQNLGILANIQGDLDEALVHYSLSLEAYEGDGDEHGCALAYHNLGMASAGRGLADDADRYFAWSLAIAERAADTRLVGLCLVNRAEVQVGRQRFEDALRNAEQALALFDRLGAVSEKAGAYRVIGMVYREIGRT